jgi:hypothetical protein
MNRHLLSFRSPGTCVHTQLLKEIAVHYQTAESTRRVSMSTFEQRLLQAENWDDKLACVVYKNGKITKMLAVITAEAAQEKQIKRWSICTVKSQDGSTLPLFRCGDASCVFGVMKGKRIVLNSKSLCSHLEIVTSTLLRDQQMKDMMAQEGQVEDCEEESQGTVDERGNDGADEDDTVEEEGTFNDGKTAQSLIGFTYSPVKHRMIPGPNCTQGPLTKVPTKLMIRHSNQRIQGKNIEFDVQGEPVICNQHVQGLPCVPYEDKCSRCHRMFEDTDMKKTGEDFMECNSTFGMTRRCIFEKHCQGCQLVTQWKPEEESLHCIYNNRMGGMFDVQLSIVSTQCNIQGELSYCMNSTFILWGKVVCSRGVKCR